MKEFLLFGKGFKKVDQWQDGCWVNICNPTQDDINYMEGLGVPDSFISDIRDPNERPRVDRDRYGMNFRHSLEPTEQDRVLIRGSYYSDSHFRRDFYRKTLFNWKSQYTG